MALDDGWCTYEKRSFSLAAYRLTREYIHVTGKNRKKRGQKENSCRTKSNRKSNKWWRSEQRSTQRVLFKEKNAQGLVNVPMKHHPTIGDISSPTDMAVLVMWNIKSPKRDINPKPCSGQSLWNPDLFGTTRGAQNGDGFIDCSDSRVLGIDLAANSRWIIRGLP